LHDYSEQGFLLVSDLIKPKIVERAHRALIAQINDPSSHSHHEFVNDPTVLACFGKEVCSAAAAIAGARTRFAPPKTTYTITVFPNPDPWHWPAPHIDHALKEDAHLIFPPPFLVGCLIYVNSVAVRSGGTVVWPGSHRQLEVLASAHPHEYKYMWELNRDITQAALAAPMELTARAGDVLFYHYLCAHSGSTNTGGEPRFALNHKW
jgi:ectoine hydroxylase-related dioxygenase (phytanoyl-CoA dioxygenase family)